MLIVLYYVRPSSETSVLTTRKFCVDTYESSSTCKRRNDLVWRSVKHSVVVSTTLSGYTQGFHEKKKWQARIRRRLICGMAWWRGKKVRNRLRLFSFRKRSLPPLVTKSLVMTDVMYSLD